MMDDKPGLLTHSYPVKLGVLPSDLHLPKNSALAGKSIPRLAQRVLAFDEP
jgi:hypothetical protein